MTYYIVKNKETGKESLVEADHKTQAFRLVGESLLEVSAAKPEQIVAMMESGAPVLRKVESQMSLQLPE